MLLKVGELARRTGVTVRALHHYDSIGLLRPSGRTEAGYRLYDGDDVARLHGIQALRRLGVPLAEVAQLLDGGATSLRAIMARQTEALDRDIARLQALRDRLGVMQLVLARGGKPGIDDWLATVSLTSTFERYFSVEELQRVLQRLAQCAADWPPLVQALRAARDRGVPADAVELQPLLQQWLDAGMRWMDGDLRLLERWGAMLREQSELPLPFGLDMPLLDYVDEAIRHRLAVVARVLTAEQLQRMKESRPQWRALVARGARLLADGVPPRDPLALALARDWQAQLADTFGHDTALRERVIAAYQGEPLLLAGMPITPGLLAYVQQAAAP